MNYQVAEQLARDEAAATYDSRFGQYQSNFEASTLRAFLSDDCDLIVDIGCGTGRFSEVLGSRAQKVIGVDLSVRSLRVAADRDVIGIAGSGVALPIRDLGASTVISIQVLEHIIVRSDARKYLGEIRRILKPGGRVLITTYNYHVLDRLRRKKSDETPSHRYVRYTEREFRDLLYAGLGTDVRVEITSQCHFLRRGTRFGQQAHSLDHWMSQATIGNWLGSFLAAVITLPNMVAT